MTLNSSSIRNGSKLRSSGRPIERRTRAPIPSPCSTDKNDRTIFRELTAADIEISGDFVVAIETKKCRNIGMVAISNRANDEILHTKMREGFGRILVYIKFYYLEISRS